MGEVANGSLPVERVAGARTDVARGPAFVVHSAQPDQAVASALRLGRRRSASSGRRGSMPSSARARPQPVQHGVAVDAQGSRRRGDPPVAARDRQQRVAAMRIAGRRRLAAGRCGGARRRRGAGRGAAARAASRPSASSRDLVDAGKRQVVEEPDRRRRADRALQDPEPVARAPRTERRSGAHAHARRRAWAAANRAASARPPAAG